MYFELLGCYCNKEVVVVDVCYNGGGWLYDDVVMFLSGKEYQCFVFCGQYIGSDLFNKWLKFLCMLVCEDNYSNVYGILYVYKILGIGKFVGILVVGIMIVVWWECQIDLSFVFGILQVGCMDMQGNYLENYIFELDVLIYNEFVVLLKGEDV